MIRAPRTVARKASALTIFGAFCFFAAGATAAPTPATGPTSTPTGPTGAPSNKKGSPDLPRLSLAIGDAYHRKGRSYALPKARLTATGAVKGSFAGQTLTIVIKKRGKTVARARVALTARGGKSSYTTRFHIGRKGKYTISTELSDELALLMRAAKSRSATVVKTSIHRGSSGVSVRVFQNRLASLKYVVPRNGRFDAATGRAFMAFRKVNGLARNESAGSTVARKLAAGKGTFRLRYPKAGRHVEISIRRQVMAFADKGKVIRIYHVSTGAPSTPTIRGTFRVYRKDPGTNAKGMVKSAYFRGGYAIHGFASVPPYNASHGCIRVPIPNAASIFAWVSMGMRIDTYA